MKIINEIQDKLSNIKSQIVSDVIPIVDKAVSEVQTDSTIEEVIEEIARDSVYNYAVEDKDRNIEKALLLHSRLIFIDMSRGTEFEKYEGFLYRINELFSTGNFYFDISISNNLSVNIKFYDDTLGSISDWAIAIKAARKLLRKSPNPKYINNKGYKKILSSLRSSYWKNIVYESDLFDSTEELRLGFLPEDSAAFIFALESGTGGGAWGSISEGGFPTPSYSSKGSFLIKLKDKLEDFLKSLFKEVYNAKVEKLKRSLSDILDFYGISITSKLSKAIEKMANTEVINIIETGARTNINKSIGVIINIEGRYYDVIKTKSGKLGLRYSISRNRRNRL